MTLGLLTTAFVFGLRHGVDWDHIAAIADLSGSAANRRRGIRLSFLYAFGHAIVVFALGSMAVLAGAAIPEALDAWMGRIVGLTLVWLGIWVLLELVRHGHDFRLRSRWMLVLDGTFAGLRRVAERADRRQIELEHEHFHDHRQEQADDVAVEDQAGSGWPIAEDDHRHHHSVETVDGIVVDRPDVERELVAAGPSRSGPGNRAILWSRRGRFRAMTAGRPRRHSHRHRHVLDLPARFDGTSGGTATGIGMLHGVGVESPTQIGVFVASTSVVGRPAGFAILAAWCVGLVAANTGLALFACFGLLEARRNFRVYATVAVTVAIGSIAMGSFYLFGLEVLPSINL